MQKTTNANREALARILAKDCRTVEDIQEMIIACKDGLTGFSEAINAVFPKTDIQLCVILRGEAPANYLYDIISKLNLSPKYMAKCEIHSFHSSL